jgi:peptidoglycan/LPS O-acetylase OafA/YrhL
MRYFKGLDIARFIAAAAVLLAHAHFQLSQLDIAWHDSWMIMYLGAVAVSFFFTLSGFLLAGLGIQEQTNRGVLNVRLFYYRRILRIWPLYFLTVAVCFITALILLPAFYPALDIRLPMPVSLLCTVFFIPNFLTANGITNFGAINGLWSIGVEECFYIFFPLLFLLHRRIKSYSLIFLAALVLYLFVYVGVWHMKKLLPLALYNFLLTYVFQFMLVGCFFAAAWIKCREKKSTLRIFNIIAGLSGGAALLVIGTGLKMPAWQGELVMAVMFSVFIVLVAQLDNRFFKNNLLVYFGKISYGIYLLHPFVSYLLRMLYARSALFSGAVRQAPSFYFILLLLLSILAAHLSYRFYERRFLKLKERMAAV